MEHAIYIHNLCNIKFIEKLKFDRIYFGNEFCENLIPSEREIREIMDFAESKKINLTFVTPWSTNKGIN